MIRNFRGLAYRYLFVTEKMESPLIPRCSLIFTTSTRGVIVNDRGEIADGNDQLDNYEFVMGSHDMRVLALRLTVLADALDEKSEELGIAPEAAPESTAGAE
jgi:hypothetical protein